MVIVGLMVFYQHNDSKNQIKVGATSFTLPEGFYQGSMNDANDYNITNGYDTLFLKECGNKNISKYINEYKNYKNRGTDNKSVILNNFTVNKIVVFKSTIVNESSNFHYWFNYNNKTYSIYTLNGNSNSDNIVKNILNSLN